MAIVRKAVLATTLIGAGVASMTGSAFAEEGDTQTGIANVDDVQTIVPTNVCNNNVPVNVLGVQVPVQDVAGNIPVLSPAEHGSEQVGAVSKSCGNAADADND